jgi:hypothetical protein
LEALFLVGTGVKNSHFRQTTECSFHLLKVTMCIIFPLYILRVICWLRIEVCTGVDFLL